MALSLPSSTIAICKSAAQTPQSLGTTSPAPRSSRSISSRHFTCHYQKAQTYKYSQRGRALSDCHPESYREEPVSAG
uniref:Uncharacterized protein n=1 Tax=Arundo donax TaxID=35708 RepID=A0A0A9AKN9_ARUDO